MGDGKKEKMKYIKRMLSGSEKRRGSQKVNARKESHALGVIFRLFIKLIFIE